MRGDLLRSARRASISQYTLSPIRNAIGEENRADLKKVMVGDVPWYLDLIAERPGFVDDQMQRLRWYPLLTEGALADPNDPDQWALFGTFLGWFEIQGSVLTYRLERAVPGVPDGVRLETVGESTTIAV
jgi:hypothetical protein